MTDKMLSRKDGGIGYVIFNNPERHNAVSMEMWAKTGDILDQFRNDPDIRVVVLTGAGGKAFVSGADISKFGAERASEEGIAKYNATTERAFSGVHEFPKPTIAMIRGYCIGGGMALATCCDMRIATAGSKFGIPAAKLGLGYDHKGIRRLMDVVGPSFAKEIFFTARQFDAEEARMMGFVNRVVPDADLESYVKTYGDTIAGNAPLTIGAAKHAVSELLKDETERNIDAVVASVKRCFDSKDYVEGRTAFMEKRKPAFKGQ
jgi:enoyl-CoA hydratase/carnithine racemase